MKIFNYIALTIFISLCVISSYAQTDYIINKDGSKVMGEVTSYTMDWVKFTPAGQKRVQKFDTDQVTELYKAGYGIFRGILLDEEIGDLTFLHVLEDGKIKLYEYMVEGQMATPMFNGGGFVTIGGGYSYKRQHWYAQKDTIKLVDIKSTGIWGSRKSRKDAFSNLISDNAHVMQRYSDADKFTFDLIRSLVIEYNKMAADQR